MRCPYCGGINSDSASYCALCGRDISVRPPYAQPVRQPQPPTRPNSQPPQTPPIQPAMPLPMPPAGKPGRPAIPPVTPQKAPGVQDRHYQPLAPAISSAPEPPAPFPPRTLAQFKQLEQGALSYTVVSDSVELGRKKTIRISYAPCAGWQQAATLLKAFREQQAEKFDTIIVQGFHTQDSDAYRFTNGQLQFDRNVRLGSQTLDRYQVETGNGFESDAIRFVLSE